MARQRPPPEHHLFTRRSRAVACFFFFFFCHFRKKGFGKMAKEFVLVFLDIFVDQGTFPFVLQAQYAENFINEIALYMYDLNSHS